MADYHTQFLEIGGMEADNAIGGVQRALGQVPGVRVTSVEPGQARVLAEPECEQLIRRALTDAGFALVAAETEG